MTNQPAPSPDRIGLPPEEVAVPATPTLYELGQDLFDGADSAEIQGEDAEKLLRARFRGAGGCRPAAD